MTANMRTSQLLELGQMTAEEVKENPTPVSMQLSAAALVEEAQAEWMQLESEQQIEDDFLRELAGSNDLIRVTEIQIMIDASSFPVSHLSSKLPHLVELNLNGSKVQSIRDLGTGFDHLRVLWLSRCGLQDLEGLSSFTCLTELYSSFNDVTDLQPLSLCSSLEVLDLESNCVASLNTLQFLSSCSKLMNLNLTGNPVSEQPQYVETIAAALSSLQMLDDREMRLLQQSVGPKPSALSVQSEAAMVERGIKHARVGMDSAEFNSMSAAAFASRTERLTSSAGAAPPPSAHIQPAGAATWLRALRSSSISGIQSTQLPQRTSLSCGSADGSSPSKESSQERPSSSRPSTARPPTSSSTTGGRPSTASQCSNGLYWQQHRLGSANSSGDNSHAAVIDSIVDAERQEDNEAQPSSSLTLGMDGNFGANFAKDLRNWKRSHAADGVSQSSAIRNVGEKKGPVHGQSMKGVSQGDLSVIDTQLLLERLIQWKVETAERVIKDEDVDNTEGSAPWVQNESVSTGGDVLQLPHATSASHPETGPASSSAAARLGQESDRSRRHSSTPVFTSQFDPSVDPTPRHDKVRKADKMMSKLVLRKVIGDVGCEVFVKPTPALQSASPAAKHSQEDSSLFSGYNPSIHSGEHLGYPIECAVRIFSVVGEIDIAQVNPTPKRPHISENGS